jgi:hypothetical protein
MRLTALCLPYETLISTYLLFSKGRKLPVVYAYDHLVLKQTK